LSQNSLFQPYRYAANIKDGRGTTRPVRLPPRTLAGDSFCLPATQQQQKLSQNNLITIVIISYQLTKNHVIIKLITLVDNKHLMANPFFSGRIPQSLYDKVEQYINESGKSKTDLLINALSSYLDFPVEIKQTNSSNGELWIVVKELQERIEKLEQGSITKDVIIPDNKDITKPNTNSEQLSLLENEPIKPNAKLLTTKEFIELPNIKKLDTQKIKTKLNNAKQQQKLPIKIENYSIEDGGKDPNSPRNILWKVTTDT
jgi:hypothetical protein